MLITEYLPAFSGHAIYLHRVIPIIKQRGYSAVVLTGDFEKYPRSDCIDGVQIRRVPFDPKGSRPELRFALAVAWFLIRHRKEFDVLHVNGHIDQHGLLTLACRLLRKKIVMQMVLMGVDDPESLKNSSSRFMSLRLKVLALMDRFIHISRPIGESCRRVGFSVDKLRYIPQGVDTRQYRPADDEEKTAIRHRLALPIGNMIVSFVGAVIPRKGVDLLVKAWHDVQRVCPEALLILIGPCDFGEEDANEQTLNSFVDGLREQVRENRLNIRMVGRSSQVEAYLQASDVFVLPSRKEGFGNVILEAMSCAVPPVVTYMDGVSLESVTPGETGLIVNSCEELASALIDLLKDDDRRRKLGANARADVLRRFDLAQIADKYLAVYDELFR